MSDQEGEITIEPARPEQLSSTQLRRNKEREGRMGIRLDRMDKRGDRG